MNWNRQQKIKQLLKTSWGKTKEANFKFELIEHYFRKKKSDFSLQTISDRTLNDIDFRQIFSFVDRTYSRIGQQFLFSKLLTLPPKADFKEQEYLIERISQDERTRLQVQTILSSLNNENAYYISRLFLEEFIGKPKHYWVLLSISIISAIAFIASFFFIKLFFIVGCLFCINLIFHYVNKRHIFMYSDSIPQLYLLCNGVRDLLKLRLPSKSNDEVVTSLKSIEPLKGRMLIFILEAQNIDFVSGLIYVVSEYVKIQFLLEPIIVFNTLNKLSKKCTDIQVLYEYFGTIDSAISIASLRQSLKYSCRPTFQEDRTLSFSDIYHPLVSNCIPNSMSVNGKSILLTGSNMSGKTTFIRSVAINVLFAQTTNTCFASDFQLSPMRIFSAIRISDDVMSGKSYYFEEVLTINDLVLESHSEVKNLFLLDEIFKGTNTIERIAAGKAVLSYICRNRNTVFVSSHDIELTELLCEEYELYHFTETVENSKVHFDYKLKEGKLTTRNAIRILEINGYPKDLIQEAKSISYQISSKSNFEENKSARE